MKWEVCCRYQTYFPSCSLVLAPGLHNEWVIDGDTDDLLDPLALHLLRLGHVAREVGLAAAGCEGPRDSEHDNLQNIES